MMSMATDAGNIDAVAREKNVKTISSHLYNAATFAKQVGRRHNPITWIFKCGKPKGAFIVALYLIVKVLYIINIVGQLVILDEFLDPEYRFWGARILGKLRKGHDWQYHGHFPRSTLCDIEIRTLGNLHRRTVQCVLMINMFNEKIYIFLWFWFIIVAVLNVLNTAYWFYLLLSTANRISFVKKYFGLIRASPAPLSQKLASVKVDNIERERVNRFVRSKLRPDGVFILRLIATNGGDLITMEVVRDLYEKYVAEVQDTARHITETSSSSGIGNEDRDSGKDVSF